jgi:hypothetical protein
MDSVLESIAAWFRDYIHEFGIAQVYVTCAVLGGIVLVGQLGLNVLGFGDGVLEVDDVDLDVGDGDAAFSVYSVRAIAGFVTFFGLVGWMGVSAGWRPLVTAGAATASGTAVMLLVAWLMTWFKRLSSKGNLDPRRAIGRVAVVYLRVPAARSGKGKVTVSIQGRSVEFAAITPGGELPTGADCRIVDMTTENTFVVVPLQEELS